jgi:hypothetical protein
MNIFLILFNNITDIYQRILSAFDTTPHGFSLRKLSAFIGIIVSISITINNTNSENLENILLIWLSFVGLAMGMITWEQIKKNKNNDTPPTQ